MSFTKLLTTSLKIEVRSKQNLVLVIALAIFLAVLSSFGISSSFLDPEEKNKIFALVIWLNFIFFGTILTSRSLYVDFELSFYENFLVYKSSFKAFFLTKLITNFLINSLGMLLFTFLLIIFNNLQINFSLNLIIIIFSVVFTFSALATNFLAIATVSKLQYFLLPIILLPLSLPIIFSGFELTNLIIYQKNSIFSSPWFLFLAFMAFIYSTLGLVLFKKTFSNG